jgi:hypothetical protein
MKTMLVFLGWGPSRLMLEVSGAMRAEIFDSDVFLIVGFCYLSRLPRRTYQATPRPMREEKAIPRKIY